MPRRIWEKPVEKWTQILIVLFPILIGGIDVILYSIFGNTATISRVMLRISYQQPLVALSTCYSFAVLMGHLFFPEVHAKARPPEYETIGRMFVVLSPAIYALIVVAFSDGTVKVPAEAFTIRKQWILGISMWVVASIGGLAGRYGLPQYLLPGELPAIERQ